MRSLIISRPNWKDVILLGAPIIMGVYLSMFNLGKQGLFLDEAFSADLVLRPWRELIVVAYQDVHPLFYYSLLKAVLVFFPLSEWSLRLLSAICAVLSLTLAMYVTHSYAGKRASIWVGWVLAWSSLHLYYAQEARMYALFELLWIISPLCLLLALERKETFWWLCWVITTAAAIHTQFYGLLLWGIGAGSSLLTILLQRSWPNLKKWVLAQTLIIVMALPLISLINSTLERGVGGTWIPSSLDPIKLLLLGLFGFSPVKEQFLNGNLLLISPWKDISFTLWVIIALGMIIPPIFGWRKQLHHKRVRSLGWIVITFGFIPPLIIALVFGLSQEQFWAPRPFIGAMVWIFIGLAVGWTTLAPRFSFVVLISLFVLNIGPLWAYETIWVKDYGKIAFQSVPETRQGSVLILDRNYASPVWNYYDPMKNNFIVVGISPRGDGEFDLMMLISNDTLRGDYQQVSCDDIGSASVLLYDPAGRIEREGPNWPSCVVDQIEWIFDPVSQEWVTSQDGVP